jgi:hypothetical protein
MIFVDQEGFLQVEGRLAGELALAAPEIELEVRVRIPGRHPGRAPAVLFEDALALGWFVVLGCQWALYEKDGEEDGDFFHGLNTPNNFQFLR